MPASESLDELFREAVAAIDAGDVPTLERLLRQHPELASARLESPGAWLRDQVGNALDGFFERPYLLWFVAEDPIRNRRLPANIAEVARTIIQAAKHEGVDNLQEQLDYALTLTSWSPVAPEFGVQLELIDVLLDAGASPEGNPDSALVNGNLEAVEHLLNRGATPTLATALCLGRLDDVPRLAEASDAAEKQTALVLAALNGKADGLQRMIELGIDVNRPSKNLYSHGTPLHHAVCSGSLDAVKVLVEAGANLDTMDHAWHATPLDWAEHYVGDASDDEARKRYEEIAGYLREAHSASEIRDRRR
jgi:peptide-methionine (S)-S-oxide reductase